MSKFCPSCRQQKKSTKNFIFFSPLEETEKSINFHESLVSNSPLDHKVLFHLIEFFKLNNEEVSLFRTVIIFKNLLEIFIKLYPNKINFLNEELIKFLSIENDELFVFFCDEELSQALDKDVELFNFLLKLKLQSFLSLELEALQFFVLGIKAEELENNLDLVNLKSFLEDEFFFKEGFQFLNIDILVNYISNKKSFNKYYITLDFHNNVLNDIFFKEEINDDKFAENIWLENLQKRHIILRKFSKVFNSLDSSNWIFPDFFNKKRQKTLFDLYEGKIYWWLPFRSTFFWISSCILDNWGEFKEQASNDLALKDAALYLSAENHHDFFIKKKGEFFELLGTALPIRFYNNVENFLVFFSKIPLKYGFDLQFDENILNDIIGNTWNCIIPLDKFLTQVESSIKKDEKVFFIERYRFSNELGFYKYKFIEKYGKTYYYFDFFFKKNFTFKINPEVSLMGFFGNREIDYNFDFLKFLKEKNYDINFLTNEKILVLPKPIEPIDYESDNFYFSSLKGVADLFFNIFTTRLNLTRTLDSDSKSETVDTFAKYLILCEYFEREINPFNWSFFSEFLKNRRFIRFFFLFWLGIYQIYRYRKLVKLIY